MSADPHVLIIASWFPTPAQPFAGSFIYQQVEALHERGVRVGVINLSLQSDVEEKSSVVVTEDPFPIVQEIRQHDRSWFPGGTAWVWIRRGLDLYSRYVQEFGRPDIIHAHSALYGGVLAERICQRTGLSYVLTEHSSFITRGRLTRWKKRMVKRVLMQVSRGYAVSRFMLENLEQLYPLSMGRWKVLPNMIAEPFFHQDLLPPRDEVFTLVNVGSMLAVKAQHLILEAMAILAKSGTDSAGIRLRIIGSGPLEKALKRQADELGINDRIEWVGYIPPGSIIEELLKGHVIVSSSETETFGLTLAESLALGRPVIATDCGGPRDIVKPGTGYLVPSGDPQALAEAIRDIMKNYSSYDPAQLRDYAEQHFRAQIISSQLLEDYKALSGS